MLRRTKRPLRFLIRMRIRDYLRKVVRGEKTRSRQSQETVPLPTSLAEPKHQRQTQPLSHLPATEPAAFTRALRSFSLWLSQPEAVLHSARLAQLTAPALHARVHRAALDRLGRAYAALCEAVRRKESRYEAAATLLGKERPFGSVSVLWQIFGLEEEGIEGESVGEASG